ncbi:hypothetical protein ABPG74_000642 [Tetrahymena malaccensis]
MSSATIVIQKDNNSMFKSNKQVLNPAKTSPTNKVFIVSNNVKSNDQVYFAPHQLMNKDASHQSPTNEFLAVSMQDSIRPERKVSNASTDSSQSTSQSQTIQTPIQLQNIQTNTKFQRKNVKYQTINPIQKFFEQDLNLQFAEDSTKFLGKIVNTGADYAIERKFVQTKDTGIKLYYTHFYPTAAKPKASILAIHGFCEHSGLYINFGDYFARQGFEVHMYDQRGFGYTGGISRCSSTEEFQQDLTAIMQLVDKSIPLYIYAHSTGTLGVLSYLIMNPQIQVAGLVSLNAFLKVPKYFGLTQNKKFLARILLMFYEDLLVNSKINLSALCKNSYHIKKMIKDEHISPHLTLRMAISLIEMSEFVQKNASKITVPIFVIHGKEDVVSKYENSIQLFNTVSSTIKQNHLIEGGFHQPHLDSNMNEIHDLINNWLNKRLTQNNNLLNDEMFSNLKYGCKLPFSKKDYMKFGFIILFFVFMILKQKGKFITGIFQRARCLALVYIFKTLGSSRASIV